MGQPSVSIKDLHQSSFDGHPYVHDIHSALISIQQVGSYTFLHSYFNYLNLQSFLYVSHAALTVVFYIHAIHLADGSVQHN